MSHELFPPLPDRAFRTEFVPGGSPETPQPTVPEEKEKTRASELTGFLASQITFTESSKGETVARFAVGYKDDEGHTHYRQTYTLGKNAERLRDKLSKGEPIKVRGYNQPFVTKDKQGAIQEHTRMYAVYVGSLKAKGAESERSERGGNTGPR